MDCLDNFIGLRGFCSDTTSESGLYINDLAGISQKLLANLAEEEQRDFTGVWNEIKARTLTEIESDIIVGSQKYFKTNLILDNQITGFYKDPYEVSTSTNELKGTTIELNFNTSRYLSIYLNNVQLYLPSAINGSIYVYNLMNGALLDTIAFTGSVGINLIEINKSYKSYGQDTKIFVCYNSNIGNSIAVDSIDQSDTAINRGAKITVGSSVISANLTLGDDSFGLIASYNLQCEVSEFICTSKSMFKLPLFYKLGANIYMEMLTSTRMNKFTITKTAEQKKDLMDHYQEKYDNLLKSLLDNFESNSDQVCFSCRKDRSYKYLRP